MNTVRPQKTLLERLVDSFMLGSFGGGDTPFGGWDCLRDFPNDQMVRMHSLQQPVLPGLRLLGRSDEKLLRLACTGRTLHDGGDFTE